MRKLLLSLAAAGGALAVASPAAAQYYPQAQPYGYGTSYGGYGYNGYGYGNWGEVRELHARIENIERQISRLDRRDRIGDRSADRLRDEANRIENRLRYAARDGLNSYEERDIETRIARLEQRVQYMASYGYGYRDRDDRFGRDRDND